MTAFAGVEKYLPKSVTCTIRGDAHNIVNMKYGVLSVVQTAVRPEDEMDPPKLRLEQVHRKRIPIAKGGPRKMKIELSEAEGRSGDDFQVEGSCATQDSEWEE